ncbi:MAG TPA: trifunctional transcriptional activator/DNA repair protein Ada/methylated-DNA--[protein]-cysteine S-methyltransferase [Acidobacteriota bacterium]|nr:trifunctional transcriptional activator/DNA repair protein Ada/methylated-DNA--[protein]-cysteine S-methyltransferase [Acidobacteriota bacterium]
MKTQPSPREMDRAMRRRDTSYDGIFYVAVRTTGIFCRPSCPARKPLAKNVEYFPSPQQALASGYRPCKRCRPLDTNGRPPDWVQRLLVRVESNPADRLSDADLRAMTIDPVRARRWFKDHYGMTFQAYARALRLGQALHQIRAGDQLTGVGYDHGFESQSGFRDAFVRLFGAPPGRGSRNDCLLTRMIESPLGPMLACATAEALCFLEFTDRRALEKQAATLRQRFGRPVIPGNNDHLKRVTTELAEYFAGKRRRFTVRLDYPGTPFQHAVWERLTRIPYGDTLSYETLARDVGHPGACRAVGTANGQNRIAILIPCHRVVNKSGKLGGYGGGLWRKQFLLDLERR